MKYEEVKGNRVRRYEDAADSDVDQEEIRMRNKSAGSDSILPVIQSMGLCSPVSGIQTQGSEVGKEKEEKGVGVFSPIWTVGSQKGGSEKLFSESHKDLFQAEGNGKKGE